MYFSRFSVDFKPTDYGIMVAGIYFIVYLAVVWLYIVGTENVVYAEVKSFLIVRPSESFSCCGEAVFEYCRYFVARVGNGVVVEVSAEYDRILLMFFHVLTYCINLRSTPCR